MARTPTMLTNGLLDALIAGLDPAIHHFGIEIVFTMDARVKPGHDASGFLKLGIYSLHFLADRGRHVRRREDDLGVRARFNLAGIILVARGFLDRLSEKPEGLLVSGKVARAAKSLAKQLAFRSARHFREPVLHQKTDPVHRGENFLFAASQRHAVLRLPVARLRRARPRARIELVSYDHAALHHKLDPLHFGHVRSRVAGDGDDVRELAFFDGS